MILACKSSARVCLSVKGCQKEVQARGHGRDSQPAGPRALGGVGTGGKISV